MADHADIQNVRRSAAAKYTARRASLPVEEFCSEVNALLPPNMAISAQEMLARLAELGYVERRHYTRGNFDYYVTTERSRSEKLFFIRKLNERLIMTATQKGQALMLELLPDLPATAQAEEKRPAEAPPETAPAALSEDVRKALARLIPGGNQLLFDFNDRVRDVLPPDAPYSKDLFLHWLLSNGYLAVMQDERGRRMCANQHEGEPLMVYVKKEETLIRTTGVETSRYQVYVTEAGRRLLVGRLPDMLSREAQRIAEDAELAKNDPYAAAALRYRAEKAETIPDFAERVNRLLPTELQIPAGCFHTWLTQEGYICQRPSKSGKTVFDYTTEKGSKSKYVMLKRFEYPNGKYEGKIILSFNGQRAVLRSLRQIAALSGTPEKQPEQTEEMLRGLTAEQAKAVQTIGEDLEVIACAGAGKTKVITLRIIRLLQSGVRPENIVAITFTRKAAAELKSRIYAYGKQYLHSTLGFASMFIGTIDGFCLKMLQEYDDEFLKYSVLDDVQTRIFVDRNADDCGLKGSELDRRMDAQHFQSAAQKQIAKAQRFTELVSLLNSSWFDRAHRAVWDADTLQMLDRYASCLKAHKKLDYSLLIRELLERLDPDSDTNGGTLSPFGQALLKRVKYLIIDEYQDTSPAQEYLVELFKRHGGANLCIVGDADQTIYQFRGSEEQNILRFREKYGVKTCVTLNRDFRSTEGVIDIAAKGIGVNPHGKDYQPMVPGRAGGAGFAWEPGDTVWQVFEREQEETDFIIGRIRALHRTGIPYREMAILLRNRLRSLARPGAQPVRVELAKHMAEALQRAGIPYVVEGVSDLFYTSECKAAAGIFEYLYQKFCAMSVGVDGSRTFGFQSEAQDLAAQRVLSDLWTAVDYPVSGSNLEAAIRALAKTETVGKRDGSELNLQNIYQVFLHDLRILAAGGAALRDESEAPERLFYNLGKFSRVIQDYETVAFNEQPNRKLSGFHRFLTHMAPKIYSEGAADNVYLRGDAVNIMTVHQSKGLEFTAVFLPALRQDIFPGEQPSLTGSRYVSGPFSVIPMGYIANAQRYAASEADERKIFYVAVTRAKKYLFLTASKDYGGVKSGVVSTFLEEAKASAYLQRFDGTVRYTAAHLPEMRQETPPIALNFSLLASYFDCPYSFKLSAFYGFCQPIRREEGYGSMLHEIIMRIHRLWLAGEQADDETVQEIVRRATYLPYAPPAIEKKAGEKALRAARAYVRRNAPDADRIRLAEADIELDLGDGVTVNGRIDLVRTVETDGAEHTAIVDLKTGAKDASECLNAEQLKIYALGYRELTGEAAQQLQIYHLDESQVRAEPVTEAMEQETRQRILQAANAIRTDDLPRVCDSDFCDDCSVSRLCGRR